MDAGCLPLTLATLYFNRMDRSMYLDGVYCSSTCRLTLRWIGVMFKLNKNTLIKYFFIYVSCIPLESRSFQCSKQKQILTIKNTKQKVSERKTNCGPSLKKLLFNYFGLHSSMNLCFFKYLKVSYVCVQSKSQKFSLKTTYKFKICLNEIFKSN